VQWSRMEADAYGRTFFTPDGAGSVADRLRHGVTCTLRVMGVSAGAFSAHEHRRVILHTGQGGNVRTVTPDELSAFSDGHVRVFELPTRLSVCARARRPRRRPDAALSHAANPLFLGALLGRLENILPDPKECRDVFKLIGLRRNKKTGTVTSVNPWGAETSGLLAEATAAGRRHAYVPRLACTTSSPLRAWLTSRVRSLHTHVALRRLRAARVSGRSFRCVRASRRVWPAACVLAKLRCSVACRLPDCTSFTRHAGFILRLGHPHQGLAPAVAVGPHVHAL